MSRNVFLFFSSFDSQCLRVSSGCKVQLLSILASVFLNFENFRFLFFLIAFNQRHHLLNLSKNLLPFGRQDNYVSFLANLFFLP
jgi:hypothetical protein